MFAFATSTCALRWEGLTVRLTEGEVWDGDDPIVKARPELFTARPPVVRSTAGKPLKRTAPRAVEQATRAPGEKRAGKIR